VWLYIFKRMVSLASEQWPDTVLPSVTQISPSETTPMVLHIAPNHVFDAWEQSCLELAKIPCQVICQFGPAPLQKTLMYGSRVMPLRVFENVHKCEACGFIKNGNTIDVICTESNTFKGSNAGWRVTTNQIVSIEIRTTKGTVILRCTDSVNASLNWLSQPVADELSCWVWSVSSKENRRANCESILECLETSGVLTDKMLNILK